MAELCVLALADDLTGALEVGAKFAARGIAAVVATEWRRDAPVAVIDVETRHLAPSESAGRVYDLACRAREAPLLYLKTDSTLRGPIAAELAALRAAWPDHRIAYVPAYPKMGRTVRQGRLYVDGVPVHQTEFARDARNPVTESHIPTLLQCDAIQVLDGETDQDVAKAAGEILRTGTRLVAGPAALAEALAAIMDLPRRVRRPWPRVKTCLVLNGSRHPRSLAQVRHAEASGFWSGGWSLCDPAADAADAVERGRPDALVVFGGDTAFAILQALGCPPLYPLGEVVPGVPISRMENLYFITKAGGFGAVDILSTLRRSLE